MSLAQRRALTAYLLLLVPLAFFLFIRLLPTLSALQVAFYQWNMLSDDRPFVGFDNFQRMAGDPLFRAAMLNTLKYVVLGVPTGLVLALTMALALTRIRRLAGLFRTVYFIPFITSLVAVGWVWRWLYQPQRGSINELIAVIGIPSQPFLQSTSQALPSIVVVNVWHDLGFQIVIFLAGLHAMPRP
ncbi:MAG: sugar ABC transporter permease [Chloroflexi bacterium]|nr:sugar ABC transporter permease [Chloroflexota bacterium]